MTAIVFFMMSPLFDITGVEVIGNEKISKETILSLSGISLGDNLYQNKKETIQKNMKQEEIAQKLHVSQVQVSRMEKKILNKLKERLIEG